MPTRDEQETTVTPSAADTMVYIFSTIPKHLRRLRAKDNVTERPGGDDSYGMFYVAREDYDPMRGFKSKRRALTEEQRVAMGERLKKARDSR